MFRRVLQVTTGTLMGFAVVAVLLSTGVIGPDRAGVMVSPFEPYPAPTLALPKADGTPFALTDLRGEVALVFFGFANCPDVCPLTLATWTQALASLGPDRTFRGVFVTVDPERDTPEALAAWLGNFDPSIAALRGTDEEIRRTASAWGIYVGRSEPGAHAGHSVAGGDAVGGGETAPAEPAPYGVEHSAQAFLVDPEGRVVRILPSGLDVVTLVATIEPYLP